MSGGNWIAVGTGEIPEKPTIGDLRSCKKQFEAAQRAAKALAGALEGEVNANLSGYVSGKGDDSPDTITVQVSA